MSSNPNNPDPTYPVDTSEPIRPVYPIWIAKTRSFWFGILPAALTVLDVLMNWAAGDATATPVAESIAWMIGLFLDVTPEQVHGLMVRLAPIYAFIVAQQRAGISRPYSIKPVDPAKSEPAATILDVKQAAETGILPPASARRPTTGRSAVPERQPYG